MTDFTPTPVLTITPKPYWMSKTLWFNVLSLLATVLAQLTGMITEPKTLGYIIIGQSLVNMLLRFVTSEPIN